MGSCDDVGVWGMDDMMGGDWGLGRWMVWSGDDFGIAGC